VASIGENSEIPIVGKGAYGKLPGKGKSILSHGTSELRPGSYII